MKKLWRRFFMNPPLELVFHLNQRCSDSVEELYQKQIFSFPANPNEKSSKIPYESSLVMQISSLSDQNPVRCSESKSGIECSYYKCLRWSLRTSKPVTSRSLYDLEKLPRSPERWKTEYYICRRSPVWTNGSFTFDTPEKFSKYFHHLHSTRIT